MYCLYPLFISLKFLVICFSISPDMGFCKLLSTENTFLTHTMANTSKNTLPYLPSMLVSQRARSSFIGSRLASCLLASHRLYCCRSVSPGPNGCCLGLRELHMFDLLHWPKKREQSEGCKRKKTSMIEQFIIRYIWYFTSISKKTKNHSIFSYSHFSQPALPYHMTTTTQGG